MIPVLFVSLALALALKALAPAPALAVTFAECQAWLCLPGGFPGPECAPAKAAVIARLAAMKPALPPWPSCAAAFGWDVGNMSHQDRWKDECPRGGAFTNGACRGTDANGCDYSYASKKSVKVKVAVDGTTNFVPNRPFTHVTAQAGASIVDQSTCPIPPPPPSTQQGNVCPAGYPDLRPPPQTGAFLIRQVRGVWSCLPPAFLPPN